MADIQDKAGDVQEKVTNASGKQMLTAAAAAAATTAATYAVRKAFSHDSQDRGRGNGSANGSGNGNGSSSSKAKSAGSGLIASAAATSWDAASDVLLPMADDAAEAAGKYVALHGPEILRERIVPKFIEAFNDAR